MQPVYWDHASILRESSPLFDLLRELAADDQNDIEWDPAYGGFDMSRTTYQHLRNHLAGAQSLLDIRHLHIPTKESTMEHEPDVYELDRDPMPEEQTVEAPLATTSLIMRRSIGLCTDSPAHCDQETQTDANVEDNRGTDVMLVHENENHSVESMCMDEREQVVPMAPNMDAPLGPNPIPPFPPDDADEMTSGVSDFWIIYNRRLARQYMLEQ